MSDTTPVVPRISIRCHLCEEEAITLIDRHAFCEAHEQEICRQARLQRDGELLWLRNLTAPWAAPNAGIRTA